MQIRGSALAAKDGLRVPSEALLPDGKKPAGSRYGFIDLLRGLAIIVMVETHVVNAYLPPADRKIAFFFWLTFVNGLVAPSFLFASGFSLLLQARRKWEDWLCLGGAFRKQLRRLAFIMLVAYYLHLPHFGLSRFLLPQDQAFWKTAFQVDVLQCIVVSLLVIDALILVMRKQVLFVWAAASVAVLATIVTPWMWAQDFTGRLPLSLAMFLNPHGVSLFPIFPWISFVLAGGCAAHFFLNAVARREDARHMRRLFLFGLIAIPGALVARGLPLFSAWDVGFYKTSPLYVLVRLGCVFLLCAGLYFMEKRRGWMPQAIRIAGQESLLIYGAHLLLIFSVLRRVPFSSIIGREAGYGVCFLLSLVLILLMLWLARLWQGWKREYPRYARIGLIAGVGITFLIFLLR